MLNKYRILAVTALVAIVGVSMALHDVDKRSEDRSSPLPNHSDTLATGALKAHGTLSSNYTTDASDATVAAALKSGIFKVVGSGTVTLPANAAGQASSSVILQTGLSYNPIVVAYVGSSVALSLPFPYYGTSDGATISVTFYYRYFQGLDGTGSVRFVYAQDSSQAAQGARPIKYYLLQQSAN